MKYVDKDLLSIQEARILIEEAVEARKSLAQLEQLKLDRIVETMFREIKKHLQELNQLYIQETGYGNCEDQFIKNKFLCEQLEEQLKGKQYVGILHIHSQQNVKMVGVPFGIIAAICPAVSPIAMIVQTAILAIKTGNAIIFAPHQRAIRTSIRTAEIMADAGRAAGLGEGSISCMHTVSKEGIEELIHMDQVSMILNAGVPEFYQETYKPYIYGGMATSPVFIERSADVKKAAKDIVVSRSFDNGTMSAAEQYVIVDGKIAQTARCELINNGAYFMNAEEEAKLIQLLGIHSDECDGEYIGKTAFWLAKTAGFQVPENTQVLVSEQPYISSANPYAKALLCPVLAYYIEDDWLHACEKCMKLLVNESKGHTMTIHSQNDEIIQQFILKKPVGRVLVNTPASLGAIGMTTNLFPATILASGTAGQGISVGNLQPEDLIYIRKAAYETRPFQRPVIEWKKNQDNNQDQNSIDTNKLMQLIIEQLLPKN